MGIKDTLLGWIGASASYPGKPVTPAKYPKGKKTQGIATHGKVMKKAFTVLGKIRGTLGHVNQTVARSPVRAYAPIQAPAQGRAPTASTSRALSRVGAAPSAKLQAAQAKHAQAVTKANQAMKNLAAKRQAMLASAKNLSRAMVAQKKLAVSMRKPKGASSLVGQTTMGPELSLEEQAEQLQLDPEFIGSHTFAPEFIGARTFAPTLIGQDPDPNNPGFLTDGSPDPNYTGGDAGGGDPTAGLSDGSLGDQIDNGAIPFAAPPPMTVGTFDMKTVGGIAYDGSRGYPDGFVGSLGLFLRSTDRNMAPMTTEIDGNEHHGFVWGQYDWKDQRLSGNGRDSGGSNKQPGGGIPWGSSLHSRIWNWVHGRHEMGSEDWHSDVPDPGIIFYSPFDPKADPKITTAYGQQFGPVVGNPAYVDMDGTKPFANMRVDAAGNMFWYPQEAPDWLTFPLKQAAALTAKATQDANNAMIAAAQAAIAKTQADAAVAKAAQDAQQAATESAATSASAVTQAQAEGEYAQTQVQQAQADLAQKQQQMQQEQQAGELLLQMAREQQDVPQGEISADGGADGQDMAPIDDGSAGYVDDLSAGEMDDMSLLDAVPDEDLTDAELAERGM